MWRCQKENNYIRNAPGRLVEGQNSDTTINLQFRSDNFPQRNPREMGAPKGTISSGWMARYPEIEPPGGPLDEGMGDAYKESPLRVALTVLCWAPLLDYCVPPSFKERN